MICNIRDTHHASSIGVKRSTLCAIGLRRALFNSEKEKPYIYFALGLAASEVGGWVVGHPLHGAALAVGVIAARAAPLVVRSLRTHQYHSDPT